MLTSPKRTTPSIFEMIAGIAGLAGLEELDDARQTAGDVLGAGGFAWDLGKDVAGVNLVAILPPSSERVTA